MSDIAVVFESFVRAGSQRHLVEILKGIKMFKPDLRCTLFLISPVGQSWSSFLPEINETGIPVVQEPYRFDRREGNGLLARGHNWLSRHLREGLLNRDLFSQLNKFSSVVCAEFFVADLLLPHLKSRQRLCFHLMEHIAQRDNTKHYRLLNRKRLNLIYMHSSQITQLQDQGVRSSSITWPVRLCPDHLGSKRPAPTYSSQGTLRVGHYSRISPMRLIHRIIDAFALLYQQAPCSLRIAGFIEDPAYLQSLLAQVRELGLSEAVTFVDPVPSPADDPESDTVDLVWMISLSGHIGYAGIEAMAAGFPTLLLEVDSRAHNCTPDSSLAGFICNSQAQIVERSLSLMDDPKLFLQKQKQLIEDRFITTHEAIEKLTDFYLG